jgi:hypothetical protein
VTPAGHLTVLVDSTGRVLTGPGPRVPTLPVAAMVAPSDRPGSRLALSGAEADTLAVAAMLPPALAARVTVLSEKGGVVTAQVLTTGPGSGPGGDGGTTATAGSRTVPATFGDPTDLEAKVTDLATLVTQVNLTGVTGIDLTVPGRPVLTGSPAPTNVSTIAGG